MGRDVWFQLVDEATRDAYANTTEDALRLPEGAEDVGDFRKAVFKEVSRALPANVVAANLCVYANRAAYDDKYGYPLKEGSSIDGLGVSEDDALIVMVPTPRSKRQKTGWKTMEFDFVSLTLPLVNDWTRKHINDYQPTVWSLDATVLREFGLYCASDKLMLFRRSEVIKQFDFMRFDVVRDSGCGYVLGSPGAGKSTTAVAFALAFARTSWIVTWIHLERRDPPVCVRLEGSTMKTIALGRHYLAHGDLKQILNEVDDTKKHIVFLDGVRVDNDAEEMQCEEWLQKNRVNRRLIVVTSMSSRGKTNSEDDMVANVREHFVSSWTLNDYYAAIEDDALFRMVRPQLDSSDDSELAAGSDHTNCMGATDHDDQMAAANAKRLRRQSLVRSKYYFAGASAQYTFGFRTAQIVSALDVAVDILLDTSSTAASLRDAYDRLFGRARRYLYREIISRYAGCAIAMFGGPAPIKRLASSDLLEVDEDSEAAMDGWMLDMFFLASIRKGGVTLYDGDEVIRWPEGKFYVVDPRNLPELPTVGWLKPHTYNQGGYDAIYIDMEQNLVQFVQIPSAHSNTFHIRFFHGFLRRLADAASSFEVKMLEIYFVIEREALSDFKFSTVTGHGLLAAFDGWEKYTEEEKARRVGIQGPKSWNEFEW